MTDRYVPKGTTDLSTLTITNGDSIIFAEGSQHVNAGLTLTATGLAFEARPMFTGTVGGGGAGGLKPASGFTINWRAGGGALYADPSAPASSITLIESVGAHDLYVQGGGTVAEVDTRNRSTTVTGDVVVTTYRQTGGMGQVRHNATDVGDIWLAGKGTLVCGRGLSGTARVNGSLIVSREDQLASGSQPIWAGATVELGDGLFQFEGNASTGTITAVNATGGKVDYSKATSPFTVSATVLSSQSNKISKLTSAYATVTANATQFGGDSSQDDTDD